MGALLAISLLVPLNYYGYLHIKRSIAAVPDGYEYPTIMDLRACIFLSVVFQLIKVGFERVVPILIQPFCKDQDDPIKVKLRSEKAAHSLFSGIYMIYSSAFGYYVLKDEEYMPPQLGGAGDMSLGFFHQPYPPHAPYLREYYISVTAYHLG
jgi:hypothetical protein